jgi:hypothetical protein
MADKYITGVFVEHNDEWGRPSLTADTLIEADGGPIFTGLFNANGTPLYRVQDRLKVGFAAPIPAQKRTRTKR